MEIVTIHRTEQSGKYKNWLAEGGGTQMFVTFWDGM
jgi:hypothetical protein